MYRTSPGRLSGSIRTALVLTALTAAGGISARTPALTAQFDASLLRTEVAKRHAAVARDEYIDPSVAAHYIVQLDEPALAMHDGSDNTLPAPAGRRPNGRLDVAGTAAKAYVNFIGQRQDNFLTQASSKLGKPVVPVLRMAHALNAVVLSITPAQAASLAGLPGVKRVDRSVDMPLNTDRGPAFIGAPNVWNGTAQGSAPGTFGEGTVFGDIDSGANFDHPSFAALGADGYTVINPRGAGVFVGACGGVVTCTDKAFGAFDFMTPVLPPTDATNGPGGGEDDNGHGTHTASTVVGNVVNATFQGLPMQISGVAPHANLVVFDACYTRISTGQGLCPTAATSASVNQAVALGDIDVINFSIGGGDSPWTDPTSVAFQAAANAGIVIAASAGNDGPDPSTLGHLEPWTMTTAASTHDRLFTDAQVTVLGPGAPGAALTDVPALVGSGPAQVADVTGDFEVFPTNIEGCTASGAFPPGTFSGIALVRRGTCGFLEKVQNATAAGATGVVVYNNRAGAPIVMGALETTTVPSVMISQTDGLAIQAFLEANPTATGEFGTTPLGRSLVPGSGDLIADFSSRGPSTINVMKPNMAAPGVSILAGLHDGTGTTGTPAEYGLLSGTSMASPHNAGAALLLRALKPTWSVPAIQSALVTSASTAMVKENGTTPADPFDRGGGRIDLNAAAGVGLLMNETNANFTAANPANGGDPRTLNLPGIMSDGCVYNCSFVRRFTNATSGTASWNLSLTLPPGVLGSTVPATITNLAAGATATVTINLDVTNANPAAYAFAQLNLVPTGAPPPSGPPTPQHLPIAVLPALTALPDVATIDTRRDAGSQLVRGLVTEAATDLDIRSSGLVRATRPLVELSQDPTLNSPYDNLGAVFVTTVQVPAGASRLIAETISAESADADVFMGQGSTPSAATEKCVAATATATERCEVLDPDPGTWWILVQNFAGSASQPDVIDLWHAVVPGATVAGPNSLYATGPDAVDAGDIYDVRVFWNEPALVAGDRAYGHLALGSTPANVGDLGEFPVDLHRAADDVTKTANVPTASVGDTVTYTISVQPNITGPDLVYTITDAIPAGMSYVNGSATASSGTVSVVGSTLTWNGVQAGTAAGNTTYVWSNSTTDAACRTGFAPPNDFYFDLASNVPPILPQAVANGDSIRLNAFGTGAQFSFYGVNYTGVSVTDDGFAVFDGANNYSGNVFVPQAVPDPTFPNNLIAMFWKDLEFVFEAGTRGLSLASAGANVVIFEYDDVQLFQDPANQYDFEIIMTRARNDAPGAYEYRIAFDNMDGIQTDPATLGVENVGGTAGVAVFNNQATNIVNRTVFCADARAPIVGATTITFQATVQPSALSTVVVNNAVHNTDNPGSLPATASASVVIGPADLSITKTDGATSVLAGGNVTYTIVASNTSATNAAVATVADTFDASLQCSWTCASNGANTCGAGGNGNISDAVALAAGGSVTYTATCAVAASATGTLSNTATITSAADANLANNSATDTSTIVAQNDLSITKTDGIAVVNAGSNVTYTIVASNSGASTVSGTVSDAFAAPLAACSWTCAGTGGNTCGASGNGDISDAVTLVAGGSVTYSATCTVPASASGTLTNTATIAGPNDPDTSDNSATDSDTVIRPQTDLSITKTDGTNTVAAGGTATYNIVVANLGAGDAFGALVSDAFPADLTCTWTCTGADGGSCTANGTGSIADTVAIAAGGSVTYVATCAISTQAGATLVNTATVAYANDINPGNNTATDTNNVTPSPAFIFADGFED